MSGAQRGVELGYAEITTGVSVTRAGTDLNTDVAGLSVTVTVGSRPIIVEFGCPYIQHAAVGGAAAVTMFEGATQIGRAQTYSPGTASAATAFAGPLIRARRAPAAGSYTYKVKLGSWLVNGAATMDAAATGPAWIQVTEV